MGSRPAIAKAWGRPLKWTGIGSHPADPRDRNLPPPARRLVIPALA
jgi:hypothetical protein